MDYFFISTLNTFQFWDISREIYANKCGTAERQSSQLVMGLYTPMLIRCLNHLNQILSLWSHSGSTLSNAQPRYSVKKTHFNHLYPKCITINEDRNVDQAINRVLPYSSIPFSPQKTSTKSVLQKAHLSMGRHSTLFWLGAIAASHSHACHSSESRIVEQTPTGWHHLQITKTESWSLQTRPLPLHKSSKQNWLQLNQTLIPIRVRITPSNVNQTIMISSFRWKHNMRLVFIWSN